MSMDARFLFLSRVPPPSEMGAGVRIVEKLAASLGNRSACVNRHLPPRSFAFAICSTLAEAAVELPVVVAVHVAVSVEIQVPQIAGVDSAHPERGPEHVA